MDYRYYYETLEGSPATGARARARAVPAAGLALAAIAAMPALGADARLAALTCLAGALTWALACALPASARGSSLRVATARGSGT